MKKIKILASLILSFGILINSFSFAAELNWEQFIIKYFDIYATEKNIPDTYQYINLNFTNVTPGTEVYEALQKAVYLNALPNMAISLPRQQKITQQQASFLMKLNFQRRVIYEAGVFVEDDWLEENLKKFLDDQERLEESSSTGPSIEVYYPDTTTTLTTQERIMQDVYNVLTTDYIEAEKLDQRTLEYGAIKGMVEAVDDKYTVYFPPTEATNFQESLQGEYEGIGAFVDMPEPGIFMIMTPIEGGPADKAGLQGGDIVTHIDGEEITEKMSIDAIIAKIKGPAGTTVNLKIQRGDQIFERTVTREKITLKIIENSDEDIPAGTCYLKINSFSEGLGDLFAEQMYKFEEYNCQRYIFDVRNNPGGSLAEVADMLNYFVPNGEKSIIIAYKNYEENIYGEEPQLGDKITDKKIAILINEGSASAAEIFAGTIDDYCPNATLIGQKTFGKNTVQSLVNYVDGSMLKFTVARWLTGKTRTDAIEDGINPEIEVIDNESTELDEQLQKAKNY